MKAGLVCPYDLEKPGGVQSQVVGLASALLEFGDEVRIIGPGKVDGFDSVDVGETVSVRANRSRVPVSLSPYTSRKVKEAVRGLDVIHVHEPLMPLASLVALRSGPPVVGTFHADPGAFGKGLYSLAGKQLNSLLGPNVRRVTAVSPTAAAPLHESLDVTIIPNGVDLSTFEVDVERNPTRVCFLGRDETRKGLHVLLEAWEKVVARVNGAELVVMGADRGIDGIEWMGRVDDKTKANVLGSSGVYVAPNLGGESFGIVLVEAMASGTAVLASDLESFQEVGGEAARYFPVGDAGALAESLTALLQDSQTVAELGAVGRERSRQFDWSVIASAYRQLYEAALS